MMVVTVKGFQRMGSCCTPNKSQTLRREYDGILHNTRSQGDGLPNATKKGPFSSKNALISLYTVHMNIAYIYIYNT